MAVPEVPEGFEAVAVRVDPETGVLYAPVPIGDVDPVEAVLSFLGAVDPDTLADRVTREAPEKPVAEGFLHVLKTMAQESP